MRFRDIVSLQNKQKYTYRNLHTHKQTNAHTARIIIFLIVIIVHVIIIDFVNVFVIVITVFVYLFNIIILIIVIIITIYLLSYSNVSRVQEEKPILKLGKSVIMIYSQFPRNVEYWTNLLVFLWNNSLIFSISYLFQSDSLHLNTGVLFDRKIYSPSQLITFRDIKHPDCKESV